jgi:hypothetical protein
VGAGERLEKKSADRGSLAPVLVRELLVIGSEAWRIGGHAASSMGGIFMKRSITRGVLVACLALNLAGTGFVQSAAAGVIGTETAIASAQHGELVARVQAKLARADLQQQFLAMGVPGEQVNARLAGLTDSELVAVEQKLDALPAGGNALAVVGIVFLVLVLLEVIGVIDLFKKV